MHFYNDGNASCTYQIEKICLNLSGISFSDREREGCGYTYTVSEFLLENVTFNQIELTEGKQYGNQDILDTSKDVSCSYQYGFITRRQ